MVAPSFLILPHPPETSRYQRHSLLLSKPRPPTGTTPKFISPTQTVGPGAFPISPRGGLAGPNLAPRGPPPPASLARPPPSSPSRLAPSFRSSARIPERRACFLFLTPSSDAPPNPAAPSAFPSKQIQNPTTSHHVHGPTPRQPHRALPGPVWLPPPCGHLQAPISVPSHRILSPPPTIIRNTVPTFGGSFLFIAIS